jgi:hypothetical protein
MASDDPPLNPLDRAIRHLEQTLANRSENELRQLRAVIAQERAKGGDWERREPYVEHEVRNIDFRAYNASQDIAILINKILNGVL